MSPVSRAGGCGDKTAGQLSSGHGSSAREVIKENLPQQSFKQCGKRGGRDRVAGNGSSAVEEDRWRKDGELRVGHVRGDTAQGGTQVTQLLRSEGSRSAL